MAGLWEQSTVLLGPETNSEELPPLYTSLGKVIS